MRNYFFLFFFLLFLPWGMVNSQDFNFPFKIQRAAPNVNKLPDTAKCIKYLNSLPLLKTITREKEIISPGIYEGFGQRYDSLAGSYLDGVAFFARVIPGNKDSVRVRVRAYSVNPLNGVKLILGTTQTIITLDSTLPLRKIAFFDSGIFIQDKVIITVEATSLSTDNFYVERNATPNGSQQNLSLVKQNGTWWQNLITNLGPEYDFDFLILPVGKKIHSRFTYTLDSTNTLLPQNLCRGDTSSFRWDFGDGKTSGSSAPSHLYTYRCVFPVKLTTYNSDKTCADSSQQSVFVSGFPCSANASFSYQVDSVKRKIKFQNTSVSACPFISVWYLNDTVFSNSVSPELSFPKVKKFQIKLDIKTKDSICTDLFSDTISISAPNSSIKENPKKKIPFIVNPSIFNEYIEIVSESGTTICIFNLVGQMVDSRKVVRGKIEKFNTSNWQAGLYFISGSDRTDSQKISKAE